MDKVVVFGGSGFVGSHVADALSDNNYKVTIFDKVHSRWLKHNQEMFIGDLLNKDHVRKAIKGASIIYHFAGIADIDESSKKPYDTINLNVIGTTILLEEALKINVKRFIFASTMYVYSQYGSFYRASKQACETIIETYHSSLGLNYNFLRYGALYGPRAQEWNGLLDRVKKIINNKSIVFEGSGEEIREYIHVKDAAQLSVKILGEKYNNQALTLTGTKEIKSKELLQLIFDIAGIEHNIQFLSKKIKPLERYFLSPYKFTPKQSKKIFPEEYIDLGEGILEMIENLHKNLK